MNTRKGPTPKSECSDEILFALYEGMGDSAVINHVEKEHPDWEYEWCFSCQYETPTFVGESHERRVCAVCFAGRP